MRNSGIEYHLHLGAHDIYPTLIDEAATRLPGWLSRHGVHVVSAQEFRSHLRPLFAKRQQTLETARHASDLRIPFDASRIVISSHGILCSKQDVVGSGGLYANVDIVLSALSTFFAGERIVIHLAIQPQHDFAPICDQIYDVTAPISWVPFIKRISDVIPGVPAIVWTVERREEHAVDFVSGVFGIELNSEERKHVTEIARGQRFARPVRQITDAMSPMSLHMDAVFANDVAELAKLPNVVLRIE